jgi:hypothetical protein
MSLRDIDSEDDVEEYINSKRKKSGGLKISNQTKLGFALLIIGLILGLILGHYYIEPMLSGVESNSYTQCLMAKEILTKENNCLYNYINDSQMVVNGCSN